MRSPLFKLTLGLLIALAVWVLGWARQDEQQVQVFGQQAEQALAKGDYASAAQDYERLEALQPNSPNILNNLGLAYYMAGQRQDSARVLEKAVRLNPDLLSAQLILGMDYVQLNQAERAIAPLERVLRRDATQRDALLALASARYALRQFDLAANVYQREVKGRPEDADAWYGLGLCFEDIAEDTSRHMAEIGKDSPYTLRLTGEFLVEQDSNLEAEDSFRRALEIGSDQDALHAALGFAHLRSGNVSRAEQEFNAELRLHPEDLDGKLGQAAVALERGELGPAAQALCDVYTADSSYFQMRLEFFLASLRDQTQSNATHLSRGDSPASCDRAMDLLRQESTASQSVAQLRDAFEPAPATKAGAAPPSASVVAAAQAANEARHYSECATSLLGAAAVGSNNTLLLARCATFSGRLYAAFEAAQSEVTANSRNMEALYWQAEAARKLAQSAFRRGVDLNPNSWQGQVLLGDIYRQRKKWDVATAKYQEAARLKPDSPAPHLGLGMVYWLIGQNERAAESLRKVLEIEPDNTMANFVLGDVYVRVRRFEDAIPHLRKSLARGSDSLVVHGDLGKAFAALGRNNEAIDELRVALPTDQNGELHYQLYSLYKLTGQTELARQALADSERLRKEDSDLVKRRLERAVSAQDNSIPQ